MFLLFYIFSQNLPITWSQSYATYDCATILNAKEFSFGFGIDNYCIYSGTKDTIAYDERRFDIWARSGLGRYFEIELKYSYPTAGAISLKRQIMTKPLISALKIGFGYMKGTRIGYITDYVYDFYGYLLLEKVFTKVIKFLYTPKFIYSIHCRDRQEHSDRKPRYITHIGHCFGFRLGQKMEFLPEVNWLWGNNEGTHYMVNQFGIGVNLIMD